MTLREKVKAGKKIIGMYVQLTDISIGRIAGLIGYDFVWVDMEHTYMSTETLYAHVLAIKATGTAVIVRAPQDDLTYTKKILEMGVDGIILPMVRSAEEANRVIGYTLYPPYGERGFGPMNAVDFGLKAPFEYTRSDHEGLLRFIQIEHKDTIDELDEIMKNEFIDGYIFGPNDLCGSYNMLGEHLSDKTTEIMRAAIDKLHENGKYVGIASGGNSEEIIKHWASFGVEFLSAGADFDFIRNGAIANKQLLERLHKNAQTV